MDLAQTILDCFPDCISQYGLLGCGLSFLAVAGLVGLAARLLAR